MTGILEPQGAVPQALSLFRGIDLIAWCPFLGECLYGARDIFGTAGCMWVSVLLPDPPKKHPCDTLVHLVGAYKKYIKMSNKIIAIRDNTSLNVIKRNRKKLVGRIKKFKKDKQGKHI